jgi:hypothetical protein
MLMNENQPPLLASSTTYLVVALKCACVTAIAQTPLLLLRLIDPHIVFYGGWALIFGYTVYRVWELNTQSLGVNDVTVVQFLGCIGAMLISGAFLCGTTIALNNPESNNPIWQVKAAFISNPFFALNVGSLAMAGAFFVTRIRALSDRPRS